VMRKEERTSSQLLRGEAVSTRGPVQPMEVGEKDSARMRRAWYIGRGRGSEDVATVKLLHQLRSAEGLLRVEKRSDNGRCMRESRGRGGDSAAWDVVVRRQICSHEKGVEEKKAPQRGIRYATLDRWFTRSSRKGGAGI